MRVLLSLQFLFITLIALPQASNKRTSYLVKYFFPDSTIIFKTNNLDTIRAKDNSSLFIPDSLETYRNGKLDGPKKIFGDNTLFSYEYKNGKLILEKVYDSDTLIYSSVLDSTSLVKTQIKLVSGRNYIDKEKGDTLLVINNTIPHANISVSTVNLLITKLGPRTYGMKIATKKKSPQEVIIRIKTYLGENKSKTEIFRLPVK